MLEVYLFKFDHPGRLFSKVFLTIFKARSLLYLKVYIWNLTGLAAPLLKIGLQSKDVAVGALIKWFVSYPGRAAAALRKVIHFTAAGPGFISPRM